jgi:catechol 2,3-dioxygenase-like lactoylglutathione lyase family enzyme
MVGSIIGVDHGMGRFSAKRMTMGQRMLGHISFGVSDLEGSIAFYDAVLAPLGLTRVWTNPNAAGYGYLGRGDLFSLKRQASAVRPPGPGFHLAFNAQTRAVVDAFHFEALKAGGTDNGGPGLRPHYGPDYYAAFVVDPDGYRIEAVFQQRNIRARAP